MEIFSSHPPPMGLRVSQHDSGGHVVPIIGSTCPICRHTVPTVFDNGITPENTIDRREFLYYLSINRDDVAAYSGGGGGSAAAARGGNDMMDNDVSMTSETDQSEEEEGDGDSEEECGGGGGGSSSAAPMSLSAMYAMMSHMRDIATKIGELFEACTTKIIEAQKTVSPFITITIIPTLLKINGEIAFARDAKMRETYADFVRFHRAGDAWSTFKCLCDFTDFTVMCMIAIRKTLIYITGAVQSKFVPEGEGRSPEMVILAHDATRLQSSYGCLTHVAVREFSTWATHDPCKVFSKESVCTHIVKVIPRMQRLFFIPMIQYMFH